MSKLKSASFLLSCSLPLVSYYFLYQHPQRMDVLTENFLDQLKQQGPNAKRFPSTFPVVFKQNSVERENKGSQGQATVSFDFDNKFPISNAVNIALNEHGQRVAGNGSNSHQSASFKAKMVHYIWMYDEATLNNKPLPSDMFKPFDDTFYSSRMYQIHRGLCILPIIHLIASVAMRRKL
ncbi:predicted protein [Naegleria gruberi]|uniref:Predicted protein n=1 Tax=Naegleria gruberi TaxID=5762 RepID=D2V4N7_NAEGR|nr:uncharacterized protein NAEGRDRAFT_63855 [Naegleria gruberi]EFC48136.1 predicted protein [Naegleria gruberi]|eukprot:XP_002680880.1 predicted protein [Naegleria gruberi strain NEG-M]